jgi:GMP synthase (glutamine-hydrolysing)
MGDPVLVLQHAASEGLGTIEDALRVYGHGFQYLRTFAGDPVPTQADDAPGLVIMGGPMGVYEYEQYSFLRQEMKLIESFLKEEKPVLGICLGSQLLAAALGAEVKKGSRKEIGWYRIHLGKDRASDPLWKDQPDSFTSYHWHGDIFDLPKNAIPLASSELTVLQAFRYGRNAYGFLFHMEVTRDQIQSMLREFSAEIQQENLNGPQILDQTSMFLPPLRKIADKVFSRWAQLLQPSNLL